MFSFNRMFQSAGLRLRSPRRAASPPLMETLDPRTLFAVGFAAPTSINVGGVMPTQAFTQCVNNDTTVDVVTVNRMSNNLSVLLGNGNGTFQAPTTVPAGGVEPVALVVADFSGDGKADIVTANRGSNNISFLRGNGNGTFQAAVNKSVGVAPMSIAMADFDGDGDRDIVTANSMSNNVSVLINNGNGFNNAMTFSAGGVEPSSVFGWFDYNSDGKPDIVVANRQSNSVTMLPGNGNGTFGMPRKFAVGVAPVHLWQIDFNHDGKQDLVVANSMSNNISFLRGTGNANANMAFAAAVNFNAGVVEPSCVMYSDVNHDGKVDLLVTGRQSNNMAVLFNNGSGGVTGAPMMINLGVGPAAAPVYIAGASLNADGQWDFVVVDSASNSISVLMGLV